MGNEDGVVKVDKELLKQVEDFVDKNRFLYTSKKQVVNLAIIEFLKIQKSRIFDNYQKQMFLKSGKLIKKKKKRTK
jgi:hypothetical protein